MSKNNIVLLYLNKTRNNLKINKFMHADILNKCFEEILNKIDILWDCKNSTSDIINLDSDMPIRYKRNDVGTRNVELFLECQFGFYTKTIALVENENLIISKEFEELVKKTPKIKFKNFNQLFFSNEINILMGAYSLNTLLNAIKQTDIEFSSYNQNFELLKAYDNTMQCFLKTKHADYGMFSPLGRLEKTDLDDVALSAFVFRNGLEVFPTEDTHAWLDKLKTQRLLEIFTIEQM